METRWKNLYNTMHEKSKIVPITKAKYLDDNELIENTILSITSEILEKRCKDVDFRYTMALKNLTKREKKKLGKWLRKSIRKIIKDETTTN